MNLPSVVRRHNRGGRRPGQTASLVLQDDEVTSPTTLASTTASSVRTLLGPTEEEEDDDDVVVVGGNKQPDSSSPVDPVCSHCLRTVMTGILEIAMDLVFSRTPASAQSVRRLEALAGYLTSYLTGHIEAIRRRTHMSNEIIASGLAHLVQGACKWSSLVTSLVCNCTIEVCLQILEETGGDDSSSGLLNGVASDWYKNIPERDDLEWMLPGYLATCLMLHRLTDLEKGSLGDPEKAFEPITNGNLPEEQVQKMLESLSILLIKSLGYLKETCRTG